ncbi:MAG: FGGY-family carbohydrate kinase [Spirochaetia bacterium]|jgi:xylulokinase
MILAYDIGTTFLKAALVSIDGKVLASAQSPVRMVETRDRDRHECDANTWLSGISLVTAQLGLREKGRIRGVVVSANGPTLVPVDDDGQPLDFAMTWMDRRAQEEADIVAEFSDTPLDASFYLPKAFWIMRHKPDIYERTRHFLPCAEYVSFFLTGNAVRIIPTQLFKDFFWNEGAVPRLHMDQEKFPPFVDVGELLGTVGQEAEETLGIPAGLPVIAGGPDFIMSIVGTACTQPGRTCDRAGTSEGINLCWSAPVHDKRLLCFPHLVRGAYNVSAMISSSGSALEWAVRALGAGRDGIDALLREAAAAPPGAGRLLFLPFLTPERFPIWDSNMRGAFLGLTLEHGRREMMRAVVESSGFAVRSVIAAMEAGGCQVADVRVSGGLARLPLWCQARADITGKKVLLPEQLESDLVGNACVGFYGLEEFESPADAAESMVRFQKIFQPNQAARQAYEELFGLFTKACNELAGTFRGLSTGARA